MINCVLKISLRRSACLFMLTLSLFSTFFSVRAESAGVPANVGIVTDGATVIEGDLFLKGLDAYYPGDLIVKGNLFLENCEVLFGGNLTLYGDVVVREGASLKKEGGGTFCTCFLGGKNVYYDVADGALLMRNVMVSKSAESQIVIADGSAMMFNGRFDAWGGRVKGRVQNSGSVNIVDKLNVRGDAMRDVILVLGKNSNFLGPDVVLETDVWLRRIEASHLLAIYLGSNKLRMEEPMQTGEYVSWGGSTGFVTNGTAADGGVEMPIVKGNKLSVGFYQFAPPNKNDKWIATIDGRTVYEYRFPMDGKKLPNYIHTPVTVNYTKEGEYLRVSPHSSLHAGLVSDLTFSYGDIYWRLECTDDGNSGSSYTMGFDMKYYSLPIDGKDYIKVMFNESHWTMMGAYDGAKEMTFVNDSGHGGASADYTFADSRNVQPFRHLVSSRSGKWSDAIWTEVDAGGNVLRTNIEGTEIEQTDMLVIKVGHTVETDMFFGEHMPSLMVIERDDLDRGRYGSFVVYMDHLNKALRNNKMYVDGSGEMECHMSVSGLAGKMSTLDFTKFATNEGSHLTIINEGGIASAAKNAKSLIWPGVYRLPDVTFKGRKIVLKDIGNGFFNGDVRIESGEVEFIHTCMSSVDLKGNLFVDEYSTVSFTGEESLCSIGGDVDIDGRLTAKGVALNFNGEIEQSVEGKIAVDEIWINNGRGVRFDNDVVVNKLSLCNGVVAMGDKEMRVALVVEGGSEWSYVNGRLVRQLVADKGAMFPVGDNARYGCAKVMTAVDGEVAVSFCGNRHHVEPKGDYQLAEGYWTVEAEGNIGLQLYYDANSGGVSATSDIVTLEDDEWENLESAVVWKGDGEGALYAEPLMSKSTGIFSFGVREALCIWKGVVDDDWCKNENWKGGVLPDRETDALIPHKGVGFMPIVRCAAEMRNLTIEEGAQLDLVGSEGRMFVAGDVDNRGEWDLYYRCSALPALCVEGEINGNDVRIIRSFLRGRLYYTGSATEDGRVWGVMHLNEEGGDIMHAFVSKGTRFVNVRTEEDGERGMAGLFEGATIVDMTGSISLSKLRECDHNMVVQYGKPQTMVCLKSGDLSEGWHWLCNPYPFAVDVRRFVSVERGAIAPAVYARGYDGGYHFFTYHTALGVGASGNEGEEMSTIAPFEAFALYVEEAGTVVILNPEYAPEGQTTLKSSEVDDDKTLLRLIVGTDKRRDELVFVFDERGSEQLIVGDSYKYGSQPRASYQIYSLKEEQRIAIAIMPQLEDLEDTKLPFAVMPSDGWTTDPVISVRGLETLSNNWNLYLVDALLNNIIDLRKVSTYIIENPESLYEGRFAILIQKREVPTKKADPKAKKLEANRKYDLSGKIISPTHKGIEVTTGKIILKKQ